MARCPSHKTFRASCTSREFKSNGPFLIKSLPSPNDAWYTISDEPFSQNLGQAIEHLRSQGTQQIILLPAFYSTLAASKNPALAGSIDRVEQINQLLNRVAVAQQVPVPADALQPLFEEKRLRQNLTFDGVHLNPEGLHLYRTALLKLISNS